MALGVSTACFMSSLKAESMPLKRLVSSGSDIWMSSDSMKMTSRSDQALVTLPQILRTSSISCMFVSQMVTLSWKNSAYLPIPLTVWSSMVSFSSISRSSSEGRISITSLSSLCLAKPITADAQFASIALSFFSILDCFPAVSTTSSTSVPWRCKPSLNTSSSVKLGSSGSRLLTPQISARRVQWRLRSASECSCAMRGRVSFMFLIWSSICLYTPHALMMGSRSASVLVWKSLSLPFCVCRSSVLASDQSICSHDSYVSDTMDLRSQSLCRRRSSLSVSRNSVKRDTSSSNRSSRALSWSAPACSVTRRSW
mmetsp:Transcript_17154/g.64984  ORF Transcript_17154/g.64984 Transcript_17154/m.64984 type:complete len:312 (+) Transcript_17154:974-1909(+)